MKIYISHSSKYDYENKIYNLIKKSDLIEENIFFFPHEDNNRKIRVEDIIRDFDMVIAEVSLPATGQGIELGIAYCAKVPILCIYEKNIKISSSLKFITNQFLEYDDSKDMIDKLKNYIENFKK